MKVLVCGGREYNDYEYLSKTLNAIHSKYPITILIQGGAKGADLLAAKWAYENNIHVAEVKALWSTRGKSAGHARNAAMLLLEPEVVVAFNGGVGTEMMVKLSSKCESVRHIWDRRTAH